MSKTKVYIDGQSGTTGLQIFDRIGARDDLELMRIDEDKRHDNEERRKFLNAADIVFLCLPDAGAREAVSLIDNPNVRVIDASTAHRTADGWTYGFPELSAEQRAAIASSHRVANPGCHATGFISCAAPLIRMGIVPADYPLTCFSLTGYSGGGKKMIANYEAEDKAQALFAPGIYGLTLQHKHIPEMVKVCGLQSAPVFLPVVDDYYKGMATTIMLHNRLLPGAPSAQDICEKLQEYYRCRNTTGTLISFPSCLLAQTARQFTPTNWPALTSCGSLSAATRSRPASLPFSTTSAKELPAQLSRT